MPEMNEFLTDDKNKRNYLTQDEFGSGGFDSKLSKPRKRSKGRKNKAGSEDEQEFNKLNQFTPGKIRANNMNHSNKNHNPPGLINNNYF